MVNALETAFGLPDFRMLVSTKPDTLKSGSVSRSLSTFKAGKLYEYPLKAKDGLEGATTCLGMLLRGHPLIRACQLDCHVRKKNVQRLAIGEAAMVG